MRSAGSSARTWCMACRVGPQGRDRVEQLTAVSDQSDTEIFQVFCRQARQDRVVDRVVAECRLILSEVKASQPTSNVHNRALTSPWRP